MHLYLPALKTMDHQVAQEVHQWINPYKVRLRVTALAQIVPGSQAHHHLAKVLVSHHRQVKMQAFQVMSKILVRVLGFQVKALAFLVGHRLAKVQVFLEAHHLGKVLASLVGRRVKVLVSPAANQWVQAQAPLAGHH